MEWDSCLSWAFETSRSWLAMWGTCVGRQVVGSPEEKMDRYSEYTCMSKGTLTAKGGGYQGSGIEILELELWHFDKKCNRIV